MFSGNRHGGWEEDPGKEFFSAEALLFKCALRICNGTQLFPDLLGKGTFFPGPALQEGLACALTTWLFDLPPTKQSNG